MTSPLPSSSPRLSNRRLYWMLLLGSLLAALLPVFWPQLDVAMAGLFLRPEPIIGAAQWQWVIWVNEYLPDAFRTVGLLALAAWGVLTLLRRFTSLRWTSKLHPRTTLVLAFFGFAMLLGPGLVTWAAKEHTLRARPFHVTEFGGERQFTPALEATQQCVDNCAFPSGHVACGFFFVSLMLIDPRRRWRWITLGLVAGALVSLARISVGAHWLSDAIWTLPIDLASSGVVWRILCWIYPREVTHPPSNVTP
jgi:lipid A 4'-phosphatase